MRGDGSADRGRGLVSRDELHDGLVFRCAVVATAVATAFCAARVGLAPSPRGVSTLLLVLGVLCLLLGGRRLLLAVIVLDTGLQVDKHLFWDEQAAAIGAIGGLSVSTTTLAVCALYVGWAVDLLVRRPDVPRPAWGASMALLAYISLCGVSVVFGHDARLGAFELVILVQALLVFVYVVSWTRTEQEVRFLATVVVAMLLLVSLTVLVLPDVGSGDGPAPQGSDRPGGTVGSPNTAASLLASSVCVAVGLLLAPVRRRTHVLAASAGVLGMLALLLTLSRGAWLGLLVAQALLLMTAWRRGWLSARVVGGVVVGAAVVLMPVWPAVVERLVSDDGGSARSRGPLNALAIDMIRDRPLTGVGLNNVGVLVPTYAGPEFSTAWLYTVHNKFLLVAAEAGVLALVAFLWFVLGAVKRGTKAARAPDRSLAVVAAGATAGIVAQLVHMPVDLFQSRPQVQQLWLLAALVTATARVTGAAAPGVHLGQNRSDLRQVAGPVPAALASITTTRESGTEHAFRT